MHNPRLAFWVATNAWVYNATFEYAEQYKSDINCL